ncbi:MAG: ABC transporter permease, partial [Thermoguttaceae bacterium]
MNRAIVWRLFWKEFRVQWQFWIAMAVLTALMQLVILATASLADRTPWLFGAALVLTAFYALGCGATLFATEHETGTFDFQRALPVSSRLLFASKTTFGVVSVLAFCGTLWLVAALMAGRPWPSVEALRVMA